MFRNLSISILSCWLSCDSERADDRTSAEAAAGCRAPPLTSVMLASAQALWGESQRLRREVEKFLATVRAA